MRKTAWNRLKSNTGASLSIALFLFLICSVLGAVLLTAATAAAGRLADLAEMDQRYYSVTSAAELVARELNGQSVTIERTKTQETTTEYYYGIGMDGEPILQKGPTTTQLIYKTNIKNNLNQPEDGTGGPVNGTTAPEIPPANGKQISLLAADRSFLTARAIRLLFGPDAVCNCDRAWNDSLSQREYQEDETGFAITHDAAELSDMLLVTGTYQMKNDGTLIMKFKSGDGSGDSYQLTATFTAAIHESDFKPIEEHLQTYNDSGYDAIKRRTEVKTTTITWTLNSMECEEST